MAVLGEHFGGGLPPYRYTVTAAAGGVSVVTGGVLAYSGTGRVATALTATVRAYDYEGHTVTTAVTLEFASTVSFAAATVTQTVAADFVGAVFALSATNGSGRFSYSVVTPVYRADGRTITVSLAGGGTVALGEGLAVGERLTMTATATDENPILGGATMGLVLEAAEAAVSLSVLFAELRLNEGNRAVASLRIAGYPRPTVSLSDAGAFDYLPLAVARDGGWLRARVFDYVETRAVTMTVADRGLGWPVLEVAHTVRWVGNRFIFNVQSRRVWRSADGEQWTRQCEDCFALRQLNHSAISYKGSLWVVGGVKFGSSDNSEDDSHFYVSGDDGVTWVTVRQEPPLPKSFVELAVHGGTLWAVGGANDKTDEHFTPLNAVHYYSEDAGQFVLATDSPPFDGRYLHFLTSFKGTMLLIAGRTYDGPGEDVLSPEIWASTDGFAWRLATATAAFGPRNGGELVRHRGRLYLYSARHSAPTDLSAIWVSDDGVNWRADYALPADLKATNTNRYEMVSHAGSLFIGGVYRGTDVNLNEVWRSADGGSWTLVTVSANFDREVSEWVVHDSSSENPTPPSSIVLSGLKPVYPVSTEEVAPVTIATLSLSGGWGDYVLDFVEEGGIFTIGREGDALFVTVTSVGAAGTEATATLRVTDATPDNAVTAEILVRFYASLSFGDASLVTHTVAADFVGEVYAPAATGGNGFSYSVFAPAYRADGGTVSVSISARQRVAVGAPLAVGERLTMTVVAGETTAHEEGRATMTLVLAAVEAVASLTVWYAQLPVSEGHRAVASLRIAGYTEATVSLASGDDFRFLPETGGGGLLRVGAATAEEEWRATLAVANRSLGWPVVSITHTVAWFGSRGLYLVGGSYEGAVETDRPPSDEEEPLSEVWSSADGGVWTGRCETGCFARGQLSHSAASYGGSLWVIGGKQDDHFYRSRDGMEWLTVAINGDSGLPRNYYGHRAVSHGGSLWVVGGGVAGDLVSDVRVYSETAGRFVLVSAGTPPPASEGHEVVSFDGRMWFFGGTTGVWTSFDGADWTTVGAALPTSGEASHVVHGGRIYHYDGSAVWSSADGRGWTAAGSAPTGGARTGDYLVSYEGSLWIVGGSPVERAIWRSADGGSWDLVTEAPAFGAASGAELVVHEVVPETGPRTGISVQGLASLYAVSTEETTPLAIATLTVVSAAGGYRMTQVEGGETVTAGLVGDQVFVTVTRVGEAETVVTALLRVGDATPENLLTVAVLVSFYAPVRFVPSLVTHTVAAGFVGAMFAPSGLGGSGEFDYSVFSPAYRADGEAVAASVAGGAVVLTQSLAVGERLTMTVVGREGMASYVASKASLTLVLVAVEAGATLATVWYRQFQAGDGNRAVASVRVWGYTETTVAVYGEPFGYAPAAEPNSGGVLRAGAAYSEGARGATVAVANRSLGWPTVTVLHTVSWFGSRGMYVAGGHDRATSAFIPATVWHSTSGDSWDVVCDVGCFTSPLSPRFHSFVDHEGSLWMFGGTRNQNELFRSVDGVDWVTVAYADVGLPARNSYWGHFAASHQGTLWLVGGFVGGNNSGRVYYYSEDDGRFVRVANGVRFGTDSGEFSGGWCRLSVACGLSAFRGMFGLRRMGWIGRGRRRFSLSGISAGRILRWRRIGGACLCLMMGRGVLMCRRCGRRGMGCGGRRSGMRSRRMVRMGRW